MRRLAGACALAWLAACAREPASPWVHLARQDLERSVRPSPGAKPDAPGYALVERDGGTRIEKEIVRSDWSYHAALQVWVVDVAIGGYGHPRDGTPFQRLFEPPDVGGGREFRYYPLSNLKGGVIPESGAFSFGKGRLFQYFPVGEEPPARATLSLFLDRGGAEDGRLRLRGNRFSGEAVSVWPGERVTTRVRVPADACLRFATTLEPLPNRPRSAELAPLVFRVFAEGASVFEHVEADPSVARSAWHVVNLEPGTIELRFEVDGPMAFTAFAVPLVGPRAVGTFGQRPPALASERPDLVVFQADTFRADNMAFYGGEPGLTPVLDELVLGAVAFERAWSVATHTLPAHAAILGGVFPRQAGAVGTAQALPEELVTLAERLALNGYRTGAVTDAVILSQRFGMDQGFEWFDEELDDIDGTLARARAFLAADDGRPTFLFVQSYEAHSPYEPSAATIATFGAGVGVEPARPPAYEPLSARLKDALAASEGRGTKHPGVRALLDPLESLYRLGVVDVDRGVGDFVDDLRTRGLLEHGYLLFLSDHGEAFGEHDAVFHGGRVWDELLRVPLFVTGGGLAPRRVAHAASLIDVAPTIARLARVAPDPAWLGTPLLELDRERPLFAFQCWREEPGSSLAILEHDKKLIGYETSEALAEGRFLAAYDLSLDPGESRNLSDALWARELMERMAPVVAPLLVPLFGARAAALDPDKLDELRHMGYGGH